MRNSANTKEYLEMSNKEIQRLDVVQRYLDKRISREQASRLLGIKARQFNNVVKSFKLSGAKGLISNKRGMPGNHCLNKEQKRAVLALIRQDYYDYGPTLAAEKLAEYNNFFISKETARKWMIADGIWTSKSRKLAPLHQPRYRRPCFGELIQIDGSDHEWFESRGERCTLIVFIDDATSMLCALVFVPAESTHAYFKALKLHLLTYGKPLAFYNDRHSVFVPTTTDDGITQFSRVLKILGIEDILAKTPQAKGRVERANGTLQDRLVKALRYHGISDIARANEFANGIFKQEYNAKFARVPITPNNVHRQLSATEEQELDYICTIQTYRVISKQLTIHYKNKLINIKEPAKANGLRQERVIVAEYENGDIKVFHNRTSLQFEIYHENQFLHPSLDRSELQRRLMHYAPHWQIIDNNHTRLH